MVCRRALDRGRVRGLRGLAESCQCQWPSRLPEASTHRRQSSGRVTRARSSGDISSSLAAVINLCASSDEATSDLTRRDGGRRRQWAGSQEALAGFDPNCPGRRPRAVRAALRRPAPGLDRPRPPLTVARPTHGTQARRSWTREEPFTAALRSDRPTAVPGHNLVTDVLGSAITRRHAAD